MGLVHHQAVFGLEVVYIVASSGRACNAEAHKIVDTIEDRSFVDFLGVLRFADPN